MCPFQKFGCKFRHVDSPSCKFQETCRLKKCQYKHQKESPTPQTNISVQKENSDSGSDNDKSVESDNQSSDENEEESEDDKLNHAAVNKFCENFCQSTSRFHIHSKNDLEMFYGLDLKLTIAKFEEGKFTRIFQCDACEHKTSEFKIHEEHYSTHHKNKVKVFYCIYKKCDFQTNDPDGMINHMKDLHPEELTNL